MLDRVWPYSSQYDAILAEGHGRPPPSFGAPTLIRHIGIWQGKALDSKAKANQTGQAVRDRIDERNARFFNEISGFLRKLQERGCTLDKPIQGFRFEHREPENGAAAANGPHHFKMSDPPALAFTLWWQDSVGLGQSNAREERPDASALRIRVVAQTYLEHATISFFIDTGKSWLKPPVYNSADAAGARRQAIFKHVEHIRTISAQQINEAHVDYGTSPERVAKGDDARRLLEAADYCYDGVWREFMSAFGFEQSVEAAGADLGFEGEVFADLRGLVHSVEGIPTPADNKRREVVRQLRGHLRLADAPLPESASPHASANVGIGRFQTFDNESGEPNTVLRAHWPFIRRMAVAADERDFVGCGILDWRCLFVSPLGSPIEPHATKHPNAPQGNLPDASKPSPHPPIRYLLITKAEPHRQQIGRFVERINAVTTMRLFALKHWPTVQNAGVHIRVLGRQLDGVLSDWSKRRVEIDEGHGRSYPGETEESERDDWPPSKTQRIESKAEQKRNDKRLRQLNALIARTERRLIQIGADLDNIGRGGSARLLYAIDRSKFFITEFERMATTLEVGNIDGWVNHDQFIDRGIQPTFDMIRNIGDNHEALRNRLQMITEMIQTSALIVEAESTSRNTEILRKIAWNWSVTQWGIWAVVLQLLMGWLLEKSGLIDGPAIGAAIRAYFEHGLSGTLHP